MRTKEILLLILIFCIANQGFAAQNSESLYNYSLSEESRTFDRGVNRNPFIYRGEFIVGVTATHGNINSSDSQILLLLNNISASGNFTSTNPYIGYTISDNRVIGAKFGFTRVGATLDSATIDLGESNDLSLDIPYIRYSQDSFNYGLFFRSYAGLDSKGHFALFADVDLSYKRSSSIFEVDMGDEPLYVKGIGWSANFNFNPGVEVYVLSNVSATLSFGIGGISYDSDVQYDHEDFKIGESTDSKFSFKFNILAINIGINIHLWR